MNEDAMLPDKVLCDKPLAITAPSWAGIASKTPSFESNELDLSKPPAVISAKSALSKTLVIEAESMKDDEIYIDKDGFEISGSRRAKRERKNSKRISISKSEESVQKETERQ